MIALLIVTVMVSVFVVGPRVDAAIVSWRRRRAEVARCGRVRVEPVRVRVDPSPRPRLTDYEARAVAEGLEQT